MPLFFNEEMFVIKHHREDTLRAVAAAAIGRVGKIHWNLCRLAAMRAGVRAGKSLVIRSIRDLHSCRAQERGRQRVNHPITVVGGRQGCESFCHRHLGRFFGFVYGTIGQSCRQ